MIEELPGIQSLSSNLLSVAQMYNDFKDGKRRGVGFFLSYQGLWTASMLNEWKAVRLSFIKRLKNAIWRPRKFKGQRLEIGKVPLVMPKLHGFLTHLSQFVQLTYYWGFLNEECFEICQQTYKYLGL